MNAPEEPPTTEPTGIVARATAIRLPVVIASLVVLAGFVMLGVAWYHVGNTDELWVQNQELVSGGLGGIGLIVVGSTLLIRDALINGRAAVAATTAADSDAPGRPTRRRTAPAA